MHYSYYKRPLLLLLILYITLLACFYKPGPAKNDVSSFISQKIVTLAGRVDGFPIVKKAGTNVIVKVAEVNGQKADGYVYARFADYTPVWRERVELTGTLKKPYSVALMGNFDWAEYLASKHVFSEIKVSSVRQVSPPPLFFRVISSVRADILNTFEQNFPRNLSAIAGGVLLGERGEIDPQLYADFQDSGAMHLLVASGGNVGFVTLIVFAFCALFRLSRKKTALLALMIAGIYTLVAGADAPLVRAYFMTVCAVTGWFLHRNSGVFQGLIISCFIILIFTPAALFETGFQMSFLATLAIVICLNNYELPYKWPRWVKFFVQIFMATLSTQLVLLPVFTNVFFKVSFAGLLANMILVPFASVLMALSFAFYICSLLKVGFLLHFVAGAALGIFVYLVEFFAGFSFSSFPVAAWSTGWLISYFVGIFLLFNLPQKNFIRRAWPVLAAIILLSPVVQYVFFNPPTVWLLNEWNKNAVLFRAPDGTRILFGAAIEGDKLARAVLKSGSRQLDAVFISQDAEKQQKEIEKLAKQIKIKQVVLPFENTWPGDEIMIGSWKVKTEWGVLLNRQKQLWINSGYSGGRDSLSYTLSSKKIDFIVAANGRFIASDGEVSENMRNATRRIVF